MRDSPFDDPRQLKAFRNLEEAVSFQRRGLFEDAEKSFARVVKKNPDYFDALHFYGLFKYQRGQFNEALKLVARATKINPRSANAFSNLGAIFAHLGRHAEALASFDTALKLDPDHLQTLSNRCNTLNELGHYDDAIASSDRALKINPNYADVYIPRGEALFRNHRYAEALESYDLSIRLNPNAAMAWVGRGNLLFNVKRFDEASAAYERALALKPDLDPAWLGRGNVLSSLKRHEEAYAAFDKALALKPDLGTETLRLSAKMFICDWRDIDAERANLILAVKNQKAGVNPFFFLTIAASAEDQLQCARLFNKNKYFTSDRFISQQHRYDHDRIRVAYLSGDFRDHAVSQAMVGVFEQHDHKRFETIAISFGPDDPGEMRTRLKGSFDQFIDVNRQSDLDVARLLRGHEVDIAVDLAGYTANSRTAILAQRPSGLQVNFLGYPATMGADYIDYLIADPTLIPKSHQTFYTEKIVYLPNCYHPTSYRITESRRSEPDKSFTRAELGLPQRGFIFCCFNNSYKIVPNVFDSWMHLLQQVEGSVLWLFEENAVAAKNLKKEAAARGIQPDRLIFAKRAPLIEHLARHRLADLFLDTIPYNAHTTANDALWAGLPILTQIGETFASRVAASLLNAVGLPELITTTQHEYTERGLEFARNPEKLAAIKQRLAQNRLTAPLFNTQLFTRHIESAYTVMHERYQAGLAPDHIRVPG